MRRRFRQVWGRFRPSLRHRRWVRLRLMVHPSRRRTEWAVFQPIRGWVLANWRSRRRELSLVGPWAVAVGSAGWSGAGRGPDRPFFPTPRSARSGRMTARRRRSGVIRNFRLATSFNMSLSKDWSATQLLQALVLGLELLQALHVLALHPRVLGSPPVPGGFGDLEVAEDLGEIGAFVRAAVHLLGPCAGPVRDCAGDASAQTGKGGLARRRERVRVSEHPRQGHR